MELAVRVYQDGADKPSGFDQLVSAWRATWDTHYADYASIHFRQAVNMKQQAEILQLPPALSTIARIRNPDLYFVEESHLIELGGVEITTHSPDGSNMDKRYPYIWVSRRVGTNAFVCSQYSKQRPTGQTNRFPYRHAQRNLRFLEDWEPDNSASALLQMVPILELQPLAGKGVSGNAENFVLSWDYLGSFFAHSLAARAFAGKEAADHARALLCDFRDRLMTLAKACMQATTRTEPSTLLKLEDRWIQVYNSRPDSGHWERGEGQFDSIDGRLMFTLDDIASLPADKRPSRFEFWLPQMVSNHPWFVEQRERGYGSKRFRNIAVELKELCQTKYADDLLDDDWRILQAHPELTLEREDWDPGVYKVTTEVPEHRREEVAGYGLKAPSASLIAVLVKLLGDESLYFSTHRAYKAGWERDLRSELEALPSESMVLVPRIPRDLLIRRGCWELRRVLPAEECTKEHLLMLRQIHRWSS